MVNALAVLGTMLLPILIVVTLLAVAAWQDRLRAAAIAWQIRLTDEIAAELGAVVAPVVRKRLWGPWQVRIAVPFARPATVGRVLSIAHRMLERMAPGRYHLVLTPQEPIARGTGKTVLAELRRRAA